MQTFMYLSCDGKTPIAAYYWESAIKPVKGLIYFAHGATEYAEKYTDLFRKLNEEGFSVLANDHMGHGNSEKTYPANFNARGGVCGWDCAARDVYNCIYNGRKRFRISRKIPVYGMGYSLGSFLVRTIAIRTPEIFSGLILVGTGYQNAIKTSIIRMIAEIQGEKYGYSQSTETISKRSFQVLKDFLPEKTFFDWYHKSKENRKNLIGKIKKGENISVGLYWDLLYGVEYTCNIANMNQMNKNLPILMLSCQKDTVGDFGMGVAKLHRYYSYLGLDSQYILYPATKPNILREKDSSKVFADIVSFLNLKTTRT